LPPYPQLLLQLDPSRRQKQQQQQQQQQQQFRTNSTLDHRFRNCITSSFFSLHIHPTFYQLPPKRKQEQHDLYKVMHRIEEDKTTSRHDDVKMEHDDQGRKVGVSETWRRKKNKWRTR
jgi:hypothetical protein